MAEMATVIAVICPSREQFRYWLGQYFPDAKRGKNAFQAIIGESVRLQFIHSLRDVRGVNYNGVLFWGEWYKVDKQLVNETIARILR